MVLSFISASARNRLISPKCLYGLKISQNRLCEWYAGLPQQTKIDATEPVFADQGHFHLEPIHLGQRVIC